MTAFVLTDIIELKNGRKGSDKSASASICTDALARVDHWFSKQNTNIGFPFEFYIYTPFGPLQSS